MELKLRRKSVPNYRQFGVSVRSQSHRQRSAQGHAERSQRHGGQQAADDQVSSRAGCNKNFSFNTFHEEYLVIRTLMEWNLKQQESSVIMTLKKIIIIIRTFFHDLGRYVVIYTVLTRRLRKCPRCRISTQLTDSWIRTRLPCHVDGLSV